MNKNEKKEPTKPMKGEKDVKKSNDKRIDEDVPGFPHHPSSPEDLKKKNSTSKIHKKK